MKANTDTTSDDDLKSIAVVLAGTRENLLTLANTQVEGEYLFLEVILQKNLLWK